MALAVTVRQVRVGLAIARSGSDIARKRRGDAERLTGDYPAEIHQ
jgi:hypothetical protein